VRVASSPIVTPTSEGLNARFKPACARLGLKQRFTKPYCPQTNGKAPWLSLEARRIFRCQIGV
jgi:transposase InsO family protein